VSDRLCQGIRNGPSECSRDIIGTTYVQDALCLSTERARLPRLTSAEGGPFGPVLTRGLGEASLTGGLLRSPGRRTIKFAAARYPVTPLPLNKLGASFGNRFRAVTQPKPVLPGEPRSPALAGVPARQARSACATRPPPHPDGAGSYISSDRPQPVAPLKRAPLNDRYLVRQLDCS
jgi:hypothetical protein